MMRFVRTSEPAKVVGILFAFLVLLAGGCSQYTTWKSVHLYNNTVLKYRQWRTGTDRHNLNQISMIDANAGFIVGYRSKVLSYRNGKWINISNPLLNDSELNSVSALSPTDVWFVGREDVPNRWLVALIQHFDGKKIKRVKLPTNSSINSIVMTSASSGWMSEYGGAMWKYDGNRWRRYPELTDSSVNSMVFETEDHGWALDDEVRLLEYDNGRWREIEHDFDVSMNALLLQDRKSLFIGGDEQLICYDGTTFTEVPGFAGRTISSMAKCNEKDVILVGENADENPLGNDGRIMYVANGKKIATEVSFPDPSPPGPFSFTSVSCDTQNHGWIVGWDGTLIEFKIENTWKQNMP